MKKCIIIANGRAPKKQDVQFFAKKGFETIICADGGANSAYKLGIKPNFIIGDFDSISTKTINHFKNVVKFIRYARQNDTDVEKCLKFAIKNNYKETVLLGVTGDRLDHTICNLGIVKKFYKKIKINLVAENSFLIATNNLIKLKSIIGETISIYGFDNKTKITSIGLKYKLKNTALPFGVKESTSNVSTNEDVNIEAKNGIIFVIRDFNLVKKYGLI
jgi:thiamine pyrophosphokinase